MSEEYENIMESLTEMLEYVRGDDTKGRTRVIEIKNLSVAPLKSYTKEEIREIRLSNNLTLKTFAQCMGVSRKTVESWERGENSPSGSSVRLFQLLEKNAKVLEECEILTTV